MMHEPEKSDSVVVAEKPTNKAEQSAAEPVEPRVETKGNAGQQSTRRAQDRASVSPAIRTTISSRCHRSLERGRQHRPGGRLPLNTNGGGLSYMHSGMAEGPAPYARDRPRPNPRRQDLGLPRCGRHVRRKRHYHHVERGALGRGV